MLKNSILFAVLIAIIALALTGFASAWEDEDCEETAWAAPKYSPGETRFVDQGNWGTYVNYTLGEGTSGNYKQYYIYAGQNYKVGTLKVYDDGDTIYVRYVTTPKLSEYHLHVVDEIGDFSAVQTKKGNPIPGQFAYSKEGISTNDTGWIEVDGHPDKVYIAAHSVVQLCDD